MFSGKAFAMEELKGDVRALKTAVYGDPNDARRKPGLIAEISHLEFQMTAANETLNEIRAGIRKLVWLVVSAVVIALIKSVVH